MSAALATTAAGRCGLPREGRDERVAHGAEQGRPGDERERGAEHRGESEQAGVLGRRLAADRSSSHAAARRSQRARSAMTVKPPPGRRRRTTLARGRRRPARRRRPRRGRARSVRLVGAEADVVAERVDRAGQRRRARRRLSRSAQIAPGGSGRAAMRPPSCWSTTLDPARGTRRSRLAESVRATSGRRSRRTPRRPPAASSRERRCVRRSSSVGPSASALVAPASSSALERVEVRRRRRARRERARERLADRRGERRPEPHDAEQRARPPGPAPPPCSAIVSTLACARSRMPPRWRRRPVTDLRARCDEGVSGRVGARRAARGGRRVLDARAHAQRRRRGVRAAALARPARARP